MMYINALIWIVIAAVGAIVGFLLTMAVFGGDMISSLVIAFAGSLSGIYIVEYAHIEISTGNKHVDQLIVAIVGAIMFAMIAAALGLNLENLGE